MLRKAYIVSGTDGKHSVQPNYPKAFNCARELSFRLEPDAVLESEEYGPMLSSLVSICYVVFGSKEALEDLIEDDLTNEEYAEFCSLADAETKLYSRKG